jgi:hypothetical protein
VTTARCPACGASVLPGAPWCTLCYAELRPAQPAPVRAAAPAPVGAAPSVAAPSVAAPSVAAPSVAFAPDPYLDAPLPELDRLLEPDPPVVRLADVRLAEPRWPCPTCGASVDIELDQCPECATPFLGGGEPRPSLTLPGVGDVSKLDKGGRFLLVVVGSVLVAAVIVAVAEVLGHLL